MAKIPPPPTKFGAVAGAPAMQRKTHLPPSPAAPRAVQMKALPPGPPRAACQGAPAAAGQTVQAMQSVRKLFVNKALNMGKMSGPKFSMTSWGEPELLYSASGHLDQTRAQYAMERVGPFAVDTFVSLTGVPWLDKLLGAGKWLRGRALNDYAEERGEQLRAAGYKISDQQIIEILQKATLREKKLDKIENGTDYISRLLGEILPTGAVEAGRAIGGMKGLQENVPVTFHTFETESGDRQEFIEFNNSPPEQL